MVTAIVIPIIIFYFYYLSKKERKKFEEKWDFLNYVKEEAIVSGRVIHKSEEKQRFYYHKFVYVTELQIQSGSKMINAKQIMPIENTFQPPDIMIGDEIKCIGEWEHTYLRFVHFQVKRSS